MAMWLLSFVVDVFYLSGEKINAVELNPSLMQGYQTVMMLQSHPRSDPVLPRRAEDMTALALAFCPITKLSSPAKKPSVSYYP